MTMPANSAAGVPGATKPLTDAARRRRAADPAHLCAPHQLPGLLAGHGEQLGVTGAVAYLADLQQDVLVPFLGSAGPALTETVVALGVDDPPRQCGSARSGFG